jgi:hypothetical protein
MGVKSHLKGGGGGEEEEDLKMENVGSMALEVITRQQLVKTQQTEKTLCML